MQIIVKMQFSSIRSHTVFISLSNNDDRQIVYVQTL